MLKSIFSISVITILIFISCKKKDPTPPPASSTTGTTTGGTTGGLTPSTGGDNSDMQTTYSFQNHAGIITRDSFVVASFYAAPETSVVPTNVNAGTVTLNGVNIVDQGQYNYYITSSLPNIAGPLTWSVSGSGTLSAFSQSFQPSYPKYTGGNLLPDTCIKANGITINISGVTNNQNSVIITLYSGSSNLTKYILGSNGSVTFTSAELANFSVNNLLIIMVDLANSYSATHNGIKQGFANTIQYSKYSYLK